ncbi:MAG: hypothetical protein KGN16_12435 [Burkholderiales bacterium]|nr:hypothetical protein [Burkholderiales bacterium]
MPKKTIVAAALLTAGLAMANPPQAAAQPPEDLSVHGEPPMLGIHWSRETVGAVQSKARRTNSPNMTYHGGQIMPTVVSKNIFWGPSWTNATFVGDKISGLDLWYSGHNLSHYAATVNEYTGSNGQVGSTTLTHQGHVIDTSTAAGGSSTSAILAEVCKQVSAGNISVDPQGNGYYAVYTDVKRGSAGYCAWHSAGTCGGIPVKFAFFFNLDGDAGCNPQDTQTGHSQGLAALANVTAHELSEARSDPGGNAWYDGSGSENGDKCAWTFNVPYVTFTDGNIWKAQGEWSNAAYTAGTGYANSSGQKGCLDGH